MSVKSFIIFGPGVMFVSKAGAYPSGAPFRFFPLEYSSVLNRKYRTRLERTNTLAYLDRSKVTKILSLQLQTLILRSGISLKF